MDDGGIAAKSALARRVVGAKSLQKQNDVLSEGLDERTLKHNKLKQARFNSAHGRVIGFLSLLTFVSCASLVGTMLMVFAQSPPHHRHLPLHERLPPHPPRPRRQVRVRNTSNSIAQWIHSWVAQGRMLASKDL